MIINTIGAQLEQNVQEARGYEINLISEVSFQIGIAFEKLHSEKSQLASEKRALEVQIEQLRSVHVLVLNSAFDGVIANIKMVVEKVKGIVEKVQLCEKGPTGVIECKLSTDATSFAKLLEDISKITFEDLKSYPDYIQDRATVSAESEMALINLPENLRLSIQSHPSLRMVTQNHVSRYETLKNEIGRIRTDNLNLISKKESLMSFHDQFLLERKEVARFRVKNILELVHSTFVRIKWEELLVINPELYPPWIYSPVSGGFFRAPLEAKLTSTAKKIKLKMENIIETLKSSINSL